LVPSFKNPPPPHIHESAASFIDPDAADCSEVLARFRANDINVTKDTEDKDYHKAVVAVTKTEKPFYISTHDSKIDNIRASIIRYKKYYEKELSKQVANIFNEKSAKGQESIFLDVGANIGWFSLLAAKHGATKVFMFEPNLQNVVRICESLNLNQWLREDRSKDVLIPIPLGLGNVEEVKKLYALNPNNPGAFTFSDTGKNSPVVGEMKITTLDSFAERQGWLQSKPSIGMMKLDAERFERYVIEGAERLIRANLIETISMELKPDSLKADKSKILSILYSAGYEMYLHGSWKGPKNEVKEYSRWEDLLADIDNKKYGENIMFRIKGGALGK